jgi:transcriptional regulator with XRE-family HTH domain
VGADFLATLLAMPEMGHRIAAARRNAGYRSQGAFAEALKVSRGLVGQWESNHKLPGRDNLRKIANLCGISREYLEGETTQMHEAMLISVEDELKLVRAYRRMTPIGKQRLVQFLTEGLEVPRMVHQKIEPA